MEKVAVVQIGGSQHLVKVGQRLEVNKLEAKVGEFITPTVLMSTTDAGGLLMGGGDVKLRVVDHKKSKKVVVLKFKAKSRYRRKKGHRQHLTVLEVVSINE